MIGFMLKLIFGDMEPGQIVCRRFFNRTDMAKNRTVIVISGPLDPHVLAGAQAVLKGESHARIFPKRKRVAQLQAVESMTQLPSKPWPFVEEGK